MISLSPSYTSNPYILASNLADIGRWPELTVPSSPAPSDDEDERGLNRRSPRGAVSQESNGLANLNYHHGRNGQNGVAEGDGGRGRPTGFPGAAGLKYTTTIMGGNRPGTFGLRVNGNGDKKATDARKAARRASARFEGRRKTLSDGMGVGGGFEEASVLEASDEDREGTRSDGSEESRPAALGVNIVGPSDGGDTSLMPKFTPPPPDVGTIPGEDANHPSGSNQNLTATNSGPSYYRHSPSQDQTQAAGSALMKPVSPSSAGGTSGAATTTPPKLVGFIPNFKGAAEMEARRRYRLQARGRGGLGGFGTGARGGAQPTQPLSLRDVDTSSSSSEPEPPSDVEGGKAQTSDEDISGNLPVDSDSDALAGGEDSGEEDGFDIAPVIDGSVDIAHEFDPYVPLPPHFSFPTPCPFHFILHTDFTIYVPSSLFGLGSFLQRVEASTSEADRISVRCCPCPIRSCRPRMDRCKIPLEYLTGEGLGSVLLRNIGPSIPRVTAPRPTVTGTGQGLVILHRLSPVLTMHTTPNITTSTVPEEIIPLQVLGTIIHLPTTHHQDRNLTS